jgi:hypothetical protein
LLRNADATRRRYSFNGEPFVAISAEVAIGGWDVDAILAGPRLRTRRSHAAASVAAVVAGGFELMPTFSAPHYRVVLGTYSEERAQRLMGVLGDVRANPHYVRREP